MPLHLANGKIYYCKTVSGESQGWDSQRQAQVAGSTEVSDLYAGALAALYGLSENDILRANPGVFEEFAGPLQDEMMRFSCPPGSVINIPGALPSLSPPPEGAVASATGTAKAGAGGSSLVTLLLVGVGVFICFKLFGELKK